MKFPSGALNSLLRLTGGASRRARLSRQTVMGVAAVASIVLIACSTTSSEGGETGDAAVAEIALSKNAAPDFSLELFGNENHTKGELITLSQYLGRPVVVNFWYPSCPPCRLEMPDLEATFQKHKDAGVELIGVQALVLDTVEEGQEFIDEFRITYAVGPDVENTILLDYGISNFPTTVFLDKNHEIVSKWTGLLTAEKLDELIAPLLQ